LQNHALTPLNFLENSAIQVVFCLLSDLNFSLDLLYEKALVYLIYFKGWQISVLNVVSTDIFSLFRGPVDHGNKTNVNVLRKWTF
jgi:hypothetical protein